MSNNEKTQSELVSDLRVLQHEYDSIKETYEKEIGRLKKTQEALINEQHLMDAIINNLPDHPGPQQSNFLCMTKMDPLLVLSEYRETLLSENWLKMSCRRNNI